MKRSIRATALAAVVLCGGLAGCTWNLSNGDQVVLTPQNAVPLVLDKIKSGCVHYDANKVTDDALIKLATDTINNAAVTGVSLTVEQIATAACPMVEKLVQTPAKAPSSSA